MQFLRIKKDAVLIYEGAEIKLSEKGLQDRREGFVMNFVYPTFIKQHNKITEKHRKIELRVISLKFRVKIIPDFVSNNKQPIKGSMYIKIFTEFDLLFRFSLIFSEKWLLTFYGSKQ